jgi:hypothetical protein
MRATFLVRAGGICLAGVLLTACPPEERPGELAVDTLPLPAPVLDPALDPDPDRIPLQPVAGSGVQGEAVVRPEAGQTRVELAVHGAPPNVRLQPGLHTGTCAEPGGGVAELEPFFTDEHGAGAISVITTADPGAVLRGEHVILIQQPERQPEPIVACGAVADLPAEEP